MIENDLFYHSIIGDFEKLAGVRWWGGSKFLDFSNCNQKTFSNWHLGYFCDIIIIFFFFFFFFNFFLSGKIARRGSSEEDDNNNNNNKKKNRYNSPPSFFVQNVRNFKEEETECSRNVIPWAERVCEENNPG